MFLYVLLFLGTWKDVLGKDDICDEPSFQVCRLTGGWQLPATEADIDRMCPEFIQYFKCLEDFSQKCTPFHYSEQKHLQKLIDVSEEVCRKDSQLHSRVVENVGCLKQVVEKDFEDCHTYLEEKADAMIKHIEAEEGYDEDVYDGDLWMPYNCLIHSLDMLCFVTKSSARCSSDASDVILETVSKSGYLERFCPAVSDEKLKEFMVLLELEEEPVLNRIMGRE